MKDYELKELLERPELNKSGIADEMYPNNKHARTTLSAKIAGRKVGNGIARLTDEDLLKAWEVLKDLADAIYSKAPQQ